MENERFDTLTRDLGRGSNRRLALKGLLGFGVAALGGASRLGETSAARRGFGGPSLPTPEPDPCGCGPNTTCIGGLCFASCIACLCGSCTVVPGRGSFCVEEAYETSGSCEGACESGFACDGGDLCMKPCAG